MVKHSLAQKEKKIAGTLTYYNQTIWNTREDRHSLDEVEGDNNTQVEQIRARQNNHTGGKTRVTTDLAVALCDRQRQKPAQNHHMADYS